MKINEHMGFELIEKIKNKELSIQEIIQSYYERIDETEDKLHSFVHLTQEKALKKAKTFDYNLKRGKSVGRLYGLPIAIKDNICVKDERLTCASQMLKNFTAPFNATVIQKLLDHHLILFGKTNLDEFAMGVSTENSSFFCTRNPWNQDLPQNIW